MKFVTLPRCLDRESLHLLGQTLHAKFAVSMAVE